MNFSDGAAFENPQNWYTRGYIPHYDVESKYQMITYRLADSLPKDCFPPGSAGGSPAESLKRRKEIEEILDNGLGSCILKIPDIAKIIIENWHHFDTVKYDLISYVVMPNHVHILIKTYSGFPLSEIVHSWKSFTSRKISEYLNEKSMMPEEFSGNTIWQKEYWDRFIRDYNHYNKAIEYIHQNPVKAGLVKCANEWSWSSLTGDGEAGEPPALPGENL